MMIRQMVLMWVKQSFLDRENDLDDMNKSKCG